MSDKCKSEDHSQQACLFITHLVYKPNEHANKPRLVLRLSTQIELDGVTLY